MQRVQKCFYKKVQKTRKFGKIWLFGLLAHFFKWHQHDVSKWVRVGWRQQDVIRWSGGLRPVHGGGELAVRWTNGGQGARSWRWQKWQKDADIGRQMASYRAPCYTARNLSEGAPMEHGGDVWIRVTSSSDRCRTISVGRRGPSEIHDDRRSGKAWSDGYRASKMQEDMVNGRLKIIIFIGNCAWRDPSGFQPISTVFQCFLL